MIESRPCLSVIIRENGTYALFSKLHINSRVFPHWFHMLMRIRIRLFIMRIWIRIHNTDPHLREPNQGGSGSETLFNSVDLCHEFLIVCASTGTVPRPGPTMCQIQRKTIWFLPKKFILEHIASSALSYPSKPKRIGPGIVPPSFKRAVVMCVFAVLWICIGFIADF